MGMAIFRHARELSDRGTPEPLRRGVQTGLPVRTKVAYAEPRECLLYRRTGVPK